MLLTRWLIPILLIVLAVDHSVVYCYSVVVHRSSCRFQSQWSPGVEPSIAANPPLIARGQGAFNDPTPLEPSRRLTRDIRGGTAQSFKISLTSGQYVHVAVLARAIILRVTLFDPTGRQLVVMSNPSGGYGPIYSSEIATTSGEYRLEVGSTEDWANPGSFEVSIKELRVSNAEDVRRVEAERSFATASQEDDARSFKTAIHEYEKSLSYWQSVRDPHWQPLTLYALSQTYRRSGNQKKAAEYLHETLKFEIDEKDWRLKAAALNDLGFNSAMSGDNSRGIALLNESLRLFETHGDRRGQASSLNNLAQTHNRMGELRKAHELVEKALPLRVAENFQSGVNNLRNALGTIHDRLGDPYKSLEYQTQALAGWQALAQAKQIDGPDRLASAFNNVALAHESLGNWDQASHNYEEALKVPGITKSLQTAIMNNRGGLYAGLGDSETATRYFSEARTVLDSIERADPDLKASLLLQIGQLHVGSNKLDDAVQHFKQAQAVKPNNPKLAYILTALGDALSRQGNIQEALKAYADALGIQLKIEDRRGQAVTRQKLGETYALSGDPAKASKEYESALSLWRALIDRRGEAATLNSIALLERDQNQLSEALEHSEQATTIFETLRTNISSHQLRTSYFARHQDFYEVNIDLKMLFSRNNQSRQRLAEAFAASERSRARSLIDTLSESHVDITVGASDELLGQEREVQRKLRAKLDAQTLLLSTRHAESDAEAIANEVSALIRQQDEVRGRIRASSSKYSQLTHPPLLTLAEVQRQLDVNTLLLEYALGDKRSYAWVVSPDSIIGFELPARDKIESVARQAIEALTARNREVKDESLPQKRARVEKAEKEYVEASAALSKMVLEPIASLLGQKRLVIVADGALQLIPFASLPAPVREANAQNTKPSARTTNVKPGAQTPKANTAVRDYALLIDNHEIVSLPSASVLALQRRELATRKPALYDVAVIADPVFDDQDERVARAKGNVNQQRKDTVKTSPDNNVSPKHNALSSPATLDSTKENPPLASALRDVGLDPSRPLPRLTHSRQEARGIARAVSSNQSLSALDFKASRETATSPELSKYRIVHFATHGILDLQHPELSGIALSMVDEKGQSRDGYLRLHEIYNLNLPAELVVLSACQTGVGKQIKGEGLIALTRGFMYAGAKSVVASLWKVDDAATSALMTEFYKQMFTNKLKPAAALREAQLKISEQKRWQSPYYWAGFFIQGDWN